MEQSNNRKCNYCKILLPQYKFSKNRKDLFNKSCDECRIKQKNTRDKNKCEHNKQRSRCKDCLGHSVCKDKCSRCKKPYKPESDNLHTCYECRYYSDCPHGIRLKKDCKECKRATVSKNRPICKHNKRKDNCNICYIRPTCEHNKRKDSCVLCSGCSHNKRRSKCKECDFHGYLGSIVRHRIWSALKKNKELSSKEYLGCDTNILKEHIEKQFTEGMTWDNYGKWHIDHIVPIKYKKDGLVPSLEEVKERLHYINTQPLWARENKAKGNRYIG